MKKLTVVEITKNEIVKFIVMRGLKAGDKLPSERIMSDLFQSSRSTTREALKMLEGEGTVKVEASKGNYVGDNPNLNFFSASKFNFVANKKFLIDLIEVRAALEELSVKLTIENATDEEIEKIYDIFKIMAIQHENEGEHPEMDLKFHKSFFLYSHNDFMMNVFQVLYDAFEILWNYPFDNVEFGKSGFPYHKTLIEATRERDLDRAMKAVRMIHKCNMENIESGPFYQMFGKKTPASLSGR
ncbi:MAG: FCD domain-containing protein [Thermotogota bacterium]|nr:FCD domain-containing protein [Thermotogota bacterium]